MGRYRADKSVRNGPKSHRSCRALMRLFLGSVLFVTETRGVVGLPPPPPPPPLSPSAVGARVCDFVSPEKGLPTRIEHNKKNVWMMRLYMPLKREEHRPTGCDSVQYPILSTKRVEVPHACLVHSRP